MRYYGIKDKIRKEKFLYNYANACAKLKSIIPGKQGEFNKNKYTYIFNRKSPFSIYDNSLPKDCFLKLDEIVTSDLIYREDIVKLQKGIRFLSVIIPTNSTFDTTIEEDFISKDSLQGQYQLKYFANSLLELDKLIDEGLKNKNFVTLHDGRKTKKNRYPIGTVSKISEGNIKKRAYFLADSDIRPNGVPIDVEASIISEALVGLWDSLTEIRHMETCSIPLIGTGKAGAADVSRNDVVKQIVISFLAATKSHKITENLIICIHPHDYSKIDWIELCEFLKYQCLFANEIEKKDKPVGKAEKTPPDIRLNDIETEGIEIFKSISNPSFIEKGKLVIELLQGNEMKLNEIAVAIGWSLGKTSQLMNALEKNNLVMCNRTIKGRIYYLGE